jgi:hypothetical protein
METMAPRRGLRLPVALLLLLTAPLCHGLIIEKSDSPIAWTVRAGDALDDRTLRSIVSSSSNEIYVLYAPSSDATALATVRFQGGYPPQTSKSLSSPSPGSLRVSSTPAVEVTVHVKEQLHHIETTSYGFAAVDRDVLVSDDSSANVTAVASGTGSVYLPPHVRLRVASLSLQSRSYASVFFVASDVTVDSLDVRTRSAGFAKLHADSITVKGTVSVDVVSYGGVSLSAASLHAAQLDVTTSSAGTASVMATSEDSTVAQCNYKQLSVGEIQAGSVVCTNAIVENKGYNRVVVRVSDSLAYSSSSFGHVYYTGARPKTITSTSGRESRGSVETAEGSADPPAEPKWAVTYTLPPHKPFDHSSLDLPNHGEQEVSVPKDAEKVASDPAHGPTHNAPHRVAWFVVAGAATIAIAFLVKRVCRLYRQHGRPNENAPLLAGDAPVYI